MLNSILPTVAVIGAGYWGKNLVRVFHELGALKNVCDLNPEIHQGMQSLYPNVSFTFDFNEILKNKNIRAVAIATPAKEHHAMVKAALNAGKDVFVEKPLSLQVEEAQELLALAKAKKRILFVGHILHYHSAILKMKQMIANGEIGRIEYVYSNRLSLGKIRREENILWSFAPHDISLILNLVGEEPHFVDAVGSYFLHPNIADVTLSSLKFPSGVSAHIFVSWLNPFKEQRLVVVGTQGMMVFEDTLPVDKKLSLYPHTIQWENGSPCPTPAERVYVDISKTWVEPLSAECQVFLKSVQDRSAPLTTGEEGLRVLKVLDACQKSMTRKHAGVLTSRDNTSENFSGKKYFVHDTAHVDEGALVGNGSKIWHFSHILKGAKIGEHCVIGQNVNVDSAAVLGNNVKVQNNVSIYTGVTVEDDVFLGPSCVLTNVSNPRAQIVRHSLYEKTLIRKGATIGANATIVCGVTIGRYAFVGAGTVVTKDVPDYALVLGNPAKQVGWMSRHGHHLKIDKKNKGKFLCPESGFRYALKNGSLRCVDIHEDASLSEAQKVGKKSYREFK